MNNSSEFTNSNLPSLPQIQPASVLSATAPRSSSHDEDNNLQKKVLELSQENIELRFELEQAKVDLPRLKERVTDLQKYNDALKADLEKAKRKLKGSSSHGSSKVRYSIVPAILHNRDVLINI